MKKNYSLALLLLASMITISSCKKDDDKPVTIVGKWFAKTEHYQEFINDVLSYDTSYAVTEDVYYEFLSDGTLNMKDEYDDIFTYTYTYDANTKKLTTVEDTDTYENDVKTLSEHDLVLYDEETEDFEGDTYKYTYEVSLKK